MLITLSSLIAIALPDRLLAGLLAVWLARGGGAVGLVVGVVVVVGAGGVLLVAGTARGAAKLFKAVRGRSRADERPQRAAASDAFPREVIDEPVRMAEPPPVAVSEPDAGDIPDQAPQQDHTALRSGYFKAQRAHDAEGSVFARPEARLQAPQQNHARGGSFKAQRAHDVDVSVFAKPEARLGETVVAQAIFHPPDKEALAADIADQFQPGAGLLGSAMLTVRLETNDRIKVTLEGGGAAVDEPVQSFVWPSQLTVVNFRLRMPEASLHSIRPKLRVFVNGALAGYVIFRISISATANAHEQVRVVEGARRFRKPFFSYATEDRTHVLRMAQVYKLAGIEPFVDVLGLSPGERWEKGLYKSIDECDAFVLFWSRHARASQWVIREAEYALERKRMLQTSGRGGLEICPVILEGPPAIEPPRSLAELHFNDPLQHIIFAEEVAGRGGGLQNTPPAIAGWIQLVPKSGGQAFDLSPKDIQAQGQLIVGRNADCAAVVPDMSVSRRHAAFSYVVGKGLFITDLQSSGGTYVDDRRVGGTPFSLEGARVVRLGNVEFRAKAAGRSAGGRQPDRPAGAGWLRLTPKSGGPAFELSLEDIEAQGQLVVGRSSECAAVVSGMSVSRRHAALSYATGRGLFIADLSSAGGTFVDGKRVGSTPYSLEGARTLRLGNVEFALRSGG